MTGASLIQVACVQMTATPDLQDNLLQAERLIRRAAQTLPPDGLRLIATPEMTSGIMAGREAMQAAAFNQGDHPAIPFFADLAAALSCWLLIGSLAIKPEPHDPDQRLFNRTLLFAPTGVVMAQYDKMHMFDVHVAGDQTYRESHAYRPGTKPVIAPLSTTLSVAESNSGQPSPGQAGICLGLTICYDLRFPPLYRGLAQAGAHIMMVPSSFTVPTGKAHWSVLLRARAIETGAYVVAPAQTGEHYPGRKTFGHSLIINPWGEVMADAGIEPGVITATLDMAQVAEARQAIPAWQQG